MRWPEVTEEASRYVEPLEKIAPRYLEEIRGIAEGTTQSFLDILALNVRTEINFGLFTDKTRNGDVPSDGCTSLAWLTGSLPGTTSYLSQNWDWMAEQAENLIICHISQPGTGIPDISQVTEGGIIGKIGLNANGVGCCLNAIRCRGVDPSKLPIHFALRTVLESKSREEAVAKIKDLGVAGSGHILVADPTGSTGLECTHKWVKELSANKGVLCHTNHLLLEHDDVEEPPWLEDSPFRLYRMQELVSYVLTPTKAIIFGLFTDTQGSPGSINRKKRDASSVETLFNIVMDLTRKNATVTLGSPSEPTGQIVLAF
ncbi:hypothetical protein DL767_001825 [Monosporascus sp. MG133]|nr:hypothetical protein DL767_001825 [Monosporascus sp. MG133]